LFCTLYMYLRKEKSWISHQNSRLNSNFITYYFIMIKLIAQELIFNYVI